MDGQISFESKIMIKDINKKLTLLTVAALLSGCFQDVGNTVTTTTTGNGETSGDGDGDGDNDSAGDGDGDNGTPPDMPAGDGDGDGALCGDGIVQGDEECDDGNPTNTDTCTNACTNAVCGDGIVWEGQEQCDDGNSDEYDGCGQCRTDKFKVAFVSSGEYRPGVDFSSKQEADALCQELAIQAGLYGHYVAFLATTLNAPSEALENTYQDDTEVRRRDGLLIGVWEDMINFNQILTPIQLDEEGVELESDRNSADYVWTGTYSPNDPSGMLMNSCENWESSDPVFSSPVGLYSDTFGWIWSFDLQCSTAAHLYCFQR